MSSSTSRHVCSCSRARSEKLRRQSAKSCLPADKAWLLLCPLPTAESQRPASLSRLLSSAASNRCASISASCWNSAAVLKILRCSLKPNTSSSCPLVSFQILNSPSQRGWSGLSLASTAASGARPVSEPVARVSLQIRQTLYY